MKLKTPGALFLIALAAPLGAARGEDTRPLSPAQIALFESDHLATIHRPERLEYRFSHESGDPAGDYVDRVHLDVRPRDDGMKDVWVDFLSGEHHRPFAPVIGFRGNPAVMFFLERDVEEMRRQTGGAATYFRNRIRQAFVDQAHVGAAEVTSNGKAEQATEITLAPFRNDGRLAAFPGLADKVYRFVLADAVPGTIYAIATEIPGETGQSPRLKESMVFASEAPCEAPEGPCIAPAQK